MLLLSAMKIAFIHSEKKISTGAHFINDLISNKLQDKGNEVTHFYPNSTLVDAPIRLKGLSNILYFYSLLEFKNKVLKYDIVQGTTYTPLPFLAFDIPVVSHFGSTTQGFLNSTSRTQDLKKESAAILYELKNEGIIESVNIGTRKPMRDIAEIEHYVASRATAIIATSQVVKDDLIKTGVSPENIYIVHNAIEDYWFSTKKKNFRENPALVFLGRIGGDPFNLKLKGVDRLINIYRAFPDTEKVSFMMTPNKKIIPWLLKSVLNHRLFANIRKDTIPELLSEYNGSILLLTSRYEGFSLSLIEGMSQGLVPIAYKVGVVQELIENGRNGFIVANEMEAIQRIKELQENPKLRMQMSEAAYLDARKFNAERMVEEMMQVHKIAVEKKNLIKSTLEKIPQKVV
jgi:glycosyltransferase involved in cell wall biosynthesis